MFDISWTELLVVAVIAIIVVGPKELPGMLRAFGKTFGQVRRAAREFQTQFNDVLREAERQAGAEDLRKSVESVRDLDPRRQVKKAVSDAQADLDSSVRAADSKGTGGTLDEAGGRPAAGKAEHGTTAAADSGAPTSPGTARSPGDEASAAGEGGANGAATGEGAGEGSASRTRASAAANGAGGHAETAPGAEERRSA